MNVHSEKIGKSNNLKDWEQTNQGAYIAKICNLEVSVK